MEAARPAQNIGAANGTAVHAAAANALTTKKDTGELGKVDDAIEVGVESLRTQAGELEIAWDKTTPEMSVAQQQVIRQTRLYHDKVAPEIKPIAVEEHLKAEIEDGFVLSGHVDVTEEFDLHDLKTGKNQRANQAQYGAYALLRRSHGGKANHLIEDYIRRVSVRSVQPDPEHVIYDGARAERQAMATVKKIVTDVKLFRETKDPWSFVANPNSFLCGDRWCPAFGTKFCGAWSREMKNSKLQLKDITDDAIVEAVNLAWAEAGDRQKRLDGRDMNVVDHLVMLTGAAPKLAYRKLAMSPIVTFGVSPNWSWLVDPGRTSK